MLQRPGKIGEFSAVSRLWGSAATGSVYLTQQFAYNIYMGTKKMGVEAYYEKINDAFSLDDIGHAGQRACVCGRGDERILRQI
jgi:hypothetical protein